MSVDAAIENRLEQARKVRYNFGYALDTRDWDLFRSLFTYDAVGDFSSFAGPDTAAIPVDTIVAMFQGAFRLSQEQLRTQQIISNVTGEANDSTANLTSYLHGHHQLAVDGDVKEATLRARYHDGLRRERGAWRIARTRLEVISISGDASVFTP